MRKIRKDEPNSESSRGWDLKKKKRSSPILGWKIRKFQQNSESSSGKFGKNSESSAKFGKFIRKIRKVHLENSESWDKFGKLGRLIRKIRKVHPENSESWALEFGKLSLKIRKVEPQNSESWASKNRFPEAKTLFPTMVITDIFLVLLKHNILTQETRSKVMKKHWEMRKRWLMDLTVPRRDCTRRFSGSSTSVTFSIPSSLASFPHSWISQRTSLSLTG